MKYRKLPVEIEAMELCNDYHPEEIARWCGGNACGVGNMGEKVWIEIETLEGTIKANFGDYIIKGVKGEFYPCKPDIFKLTYEKVDDGI